jgi:hypothetical protein
MPSDGNTAVIKSFEYGHTDGFSLRVTMEDQKGGSLEAVAEHLTSIWHETNSDKFICLFQFGWARSGCSTPLPHLRSDCYVSYSINMEASYSQGKVFIEMTAADMMHIAQEGSSEDHLGSEDQPIHLVDAIRQLLTSGTNEYPRIGKVSFLKKSDGDTPLPVGFESFDPCDLGRLKSEFGIENPTLEDCKMLGPKGYWRAEGEDKLSIVRRWLGDYRTENKKGWIPSWDETASADDKTSGKHLIFWEDFVPNCLTVDASWWRSSCLGTFIVNAGRDSPVIEFNPRIKWAFDYGVNVQGGTANNELSPFKGDGTGIPGKNTKSPGRFECAPLMRKVERGKGPPHTIAADQNVIDKNGAGATEQVSKAVDANEKANMRLMASNIEASMVLVGDPTLVDMARVMSGKTVSIHMINPFFIRGKDFRDYEWLASPPENYVIRNSAWIVKGCNHKIESGSYTTTLNLALAVPGMDGAPGENLGLSSDGAKIN